MLHELRIENLLLIERAELRLGEGLNAITGETGAGKTVLAHSLDLLMGGKARPQIVRPGAEEAYVEGVFDMPEGLMADPELAGLAERLPDDAKEVILGRRVGASGRTSAFIQGRSASAAELTLLGSRLLAFYGQHEHRRLALGSAQLEVLDSFAGGEHLERRHHYRAVHRRCLALERELAELRELEGARERDLDLLRFELSEIEAAAPDAAEQADLLAERERLRHAEGLREAAAGALAAVGGVDDEGGAASALAIAESALAGVAGVDRDLDAIGERAAALRLELDELAGDTRDYVERIDGDPARLQQVEERLDAIDRLERKHGGSIESVLAHAERCRAEIERLAGAETRGAEIEKELEAAQEERAALAKQLSESRRKAARRLEKQVAEELGELAMEGAQLKVGFAAHTDGFGPHGAETVELLVATNPGLPVAPLRDAASGGELSRLMLALAGLASEGGGSTLVFDEIDAGVGGATARAVGERLRALGAHRQVLCITHLPQVASQASTHFRIEKAVAGGEALATAELIDGEELVAEITRMLGAERDDATATTHARELLAAA